VQFGVPDCSVANLLPKRRGVCVESEYTDDCNVRKSKLIS
jgi:hypothetical protein